MHIKHNIDPRKDDPIIISEIGNCHFGNLKLAKEMIRISKECGATLVKSQAFVGKDILHGSMPVKFYEQCSFSFNEYIELINYGLSIDIPVFFSIFSPSLSRLEEHQPFRKLSANHVRHQDYSISIHDNENCFVSVPCDCIPPSFHYAKMMMVTDYLENNPNLNRINILRKMYQRPVGYSDHTIGINKCLEAYGVYGARYIEKHFTLDKNFKFENILYRDCIHSATPEEFYNLAKQIHIGSML